MSFHDQQTLNTAGALSPKLSLEETSAPPPHEVPSPRDLTTTLSHTSCCVFTAALCTSLDLRQRRPAQMAANSANNCLYEQMKHTPTETIHGSETNNNFEPGSLQI